MKITVEFELTEHNARVLRSWASIGRFMDCVRRACEEPTNEDAVEAALDGVDMLKDPLSVLHMQIREKLVEAGVKPLWDQNQK
jgi:hypothetical protein